LANVKRSSSRKVLGGILRSYREMAGVSQEELGFSADLHRNYIGMVERGERNPTFDVLDRWLKALKISWAYFGDALDREARG
jgi:transcriptional regulator with XRE-family HTH domain